MDPLYIVEAYTAEDRSKFSLYAIRAADEATAERAVRAVSSEAFRVDVTLAKEALQSALERLPSDQPIFLSNHETTWLQHG